MNAAISTVLSPGTKELPRHRLPHREAFVAVCFAFFTLRDAVIAKTSLKSQVVVAVW